MKIFYRVIAVATALSILSVLLVPGIDDTVEGLFQLLVLILMMARVLSSNLVNLCSLPVIVIAFD